MKTIEQARHPSQEVRDFVAQQQTGLLSTYSVSVPGYPFGSIAPYDIHVLSLDGGSTEVLTRAEELVATLGEAGLDVLFDDRDERPGEKFADADLIGCPSRIIVGKKTLDDEAVDVRRRDKSSDERVAASDVLKWVLQA